MITFCDPSTAREFFTQTWQFSFIFLLFMPRICAHLITSQIPQFPASGREVVRRPADFLLEKCFTQNHFFSIFNICILTKTGSKQRTLKGVNYLVISITFLVLKYKCEIIHPLMTAIGLSFMVFLLIPAA